MRRILVDYARQRKAEKRGGAQPRKLSIDDLPEDASRSSELPDFERLDDALKALAAIAPEKAQTVELRYFAGPVGGRNRARDGHLARHRRTPLGLRARVAAPRAVARGAGRVTGFATDSAD